MKKNTSEVVFEILTKEDDVRTCQDIPDKACQDQPQNFIKQITSLSLSKVADNLIDPKLILSWILTTLGAPLYFVALLVPIREAGALAPQLLLANFIKSLRLRKKAWALGSLIQGLCAIAMGIAVLMLENFFLGLAITAFLMLLALTRSICSVSYKDVLGKTIDKSKRGTATGTASSIAAAMVIFYALILSSNYFDKLHLVTIGLFLAGFFWVLAAFIFVTLSEEPSASADNENPFSTVQKNVKLLINDRQLILFITARGLLIATALSPPFIVALEVNSLESGFAGLGWLILASATAGLLSGYIWGRLADYSSRKVLLLSGLLSGLSLTAIVFGHHFGYLQSTAWSIPVLLFILMIAHQGVRLGRSTHLIDMTDDNKRSMYTALSNTIIGILLLLGALFSVLASHQGELFVLTIFACMCFASIMSSYFLTEAQKK